jgi:Ca2+-binding EF-hand superfamily protein
MPQRSIKALWCALDANGSNTLEKEEVGSFLRLGTDALPKRPAVQVRHSETLVGETERHGMGRALDCTPTAKLLEELEQAGVPLPSRSEMLELSRTLNRWLADYRYTILGENSAPSWFNMYAVLDQDGSGFITYDELTNAVRQKLKRIESEMPQRSIKALWCALDANGSNTLEKEEVGSFLRLGTDALPKRTGRQIYKAPSLTSSFERHGMSGALDCTPTAKLLEELERAGVALPTPHELSGLARLLIKWLEEYRKMVLYQNSAPSWFNIYEVLDQDGSGFITYDELTNAIRQKAKKHETVISQKTIKALWCALDSDGSNMLEKEEVGSFLRLGLGAKPKRAASKVLIPRPKPSARPFDVLAAAAARNPMPYSKLAEERAERAALDRAEAVARTAEAAEKEQRRRLLRAAEATAPHERTEHQLKLVEEAKREKARRERLAMHRGAPSLGVRNATAENQVKDQVRVSLKSERPWRSPPAGYTQQGNPRGNGLVLPAPVGSALAVLRPRLVASNVQLSHSHSIAAIDEAAVAPPHRQQTRRKPPKFDTSPRMPGINAPKARGFLYELGKPAVYDGKVDFNGSLPPGSPPGSGRRSAIQGSDHFLSDWITSCNGMIWPSNLSQPAMLQSSHSAPGLMLPTSAQVTGAEVDAVLAMCTRRSVAALKRPPLAGQLTVASAGTAASGVVPPEYRSPPPSANSDSSYEAARAMIEELAADAKAYQRAKEKAAIANAAARPTVRPRAAGAQASAGNALDTTALRATSNPPRSYSVVVPPELGRRFHVPLPKAAGVSSRFQVSIRSLQIPR